MYLVVSISVPIFCCLESHQIFILLSFPPIQPAWLANAADDPSYKPRIQRMSAVPMREFLEYHDSDENASVTSPVSLNAHPPPTPPSHKNFAPPIPPRHRV